MKTPALVAVMLAVAATVATPAGVADAAGGSHLYRIFGSPQGRDGLEVLSDSCTHLGEHPDTSHWPLHIAGGEGAPYGPHGIGWVAQGMGSSRGIVAFTSSPGSIDKYDLRIDHPTSAAVHPVYTALLYSGSDPSSVWLGQDETNDGIAGWHQINGSDVTYQWNHLEGGVSDGQAANPSTVQSFVASHPTEASTGRFGVFFGCDGATTYVDGLELGNTATGWNTYNFDGLATSTALHIRGTSTCRISSPSFPDRVKMAGTVTRPGPWAIYSLKGHTEHQVAHGTTGHGFAQILRVSRSQRYFATSPVTRNAEYSSSKAYFVPAVPSIKVKPTSSHVKVHQGEKATGLVKPRGSRPFTAVLSRWTGKKWTTFKPVGHGHTTRGGRFSIKAPTNRPGTFRLAIVTQTTHDLEGTISRNSAEYVVTKPKAPKHHVKAPTHTGSPTSGTSNPTPPAPPAPPTTPPPPHHRVVVGSGTTRSKGYGVCGWHTSGKP